MAAIYKFLLVACIGLGVACGNMSVSVPTPTASAPITVSLQNTAVPSVTADALMTRAEQNGVTLTVTLPRGTFWASEMVQANVKLENKGSETFAYSAPFGLYSLEVLGARGEDIVENPWRGMNIRFGGRTWVGTLKPGDVVTQNVYFQIPATPNPTAYSLWVTARVGQAPVNGEQGNPTLAFNLEAGPISLPALAPDAAHQLRLHMHAGKDGYQLTTTDGLGNPVSTQVNGTQEISMGHIDAVGSLQFDATGQVNHVWRKDEGYATGGRIEVWVWADGYAVNNLAFRTPGDVVSQHGWIAPAVDTREKFDTIRAAQAQFDLKLYTLGERPDGLQLDSVLGQGGADDGGLRFVVDAYYRLKDGGVMKFSQAGFRQNERYVSSELAGAYDREAVAVPVGTHTGYVKEGLDRRQLEWERDGINMRLDAPRAAFTQAELVNMAAKIVPLP